MLVMLVVLVMFVVNLCPKADQPHQKGMCWSHCSMTEQWCLLAHLRYMVGLYHLTINMSTPLTWLLAAGDARIVSSTGLVQGSRC